MSPQIPIYFGVGFWPWIFPLPGCYTLHCQQLKSPDVFVAGIQIYRNNIIVFLGLIIYFVITVATLLLPLSSFFRCLLQHVVVHNLSMSNFRDEVDPSTSSVSDVVIGECHEYGRPSAVVQTEYVKQVGTLRLLSWNCQINLCCAD